MLKDGPIPLYYQIKNVIKSRIESGEYKTGSKMPSELEMAKEFNVSRPTIRQAMLILVQLGYLTKSRGKGTFIATPKLEQGFIGSLEGFSEEMKRRNIKFKTKVIEFSKKKADEKVAISLNIDINDDIVLLKRLRIINDNEPVYFVISYLPFSKFTGIFKYDFSEQSLYKIIEEEYGYTIHRGKRTFEPVYPLEEDKKVLHCSDKAPLLYIESIVYTEKNIPIEYLEAKISGEFNKFTIHLYKDKEGVYV